MTVSIHRTGDFFREAFPAHQDAGPGGVPEEATMDWMSALFVAVIVLVAEALGMSFMRS